MSNKVMRHVGKDHLGNKVIVIFREIPDDPEHCLVVQSNTLPDMYHDNMMNTLESTEAQQTVDLFEVLNRRSFGDGNHMLNTLHNRGLLKKMSVDQVNLEPLPNRQLPLREANAAIANDPERRKPNQESPQVPAAAPVETPKTTVETPVPQGEDVDDSDVKRARAQGLLEQARLLESDAKGYREQAYALDPSLKAGGRPPSKKTSKKKKAAAKK